MISILIDFKNDNVGFDLDSIKLTGVLNYEIIDEEDWELLKKSINHIPLDSFEENTTYYLYLTRLTYEMNGNKTPDVEFILVHDEKA